MGLSLSSQNKLNSTLTLQGMKHFLLPALLPLQYTTPRKRREGRGREREREEEESTSNSTSTPCHRHIHRTDTTDLPKLSLVRAVHNLTSDLRSHSTRLSRPLGTHHAGFIHVTVGSPFPRADVASFPTGCTEGKPAKAKQC